MKLNDETKSIIAEIKEWLGIEIEYLKLSATERISVIASSLILFVILLAIGLVAMIILAFSLVDLFNLFMCPALACLSAVGVLILVGAMLFVFRRPLIVDPITKFISKSLLRKKSDDK